MAAAGGSPQLLRPDWAVPALVNAACSTRVGGTSSGPYESLNLGDHVGDAPETVERNRSLYAAALGARPVFLKQVHGIGVVRLDRGTRDATEADACWTSEPGLACTMMVADCMPVLLADGDGRAVGAAHCGWRGLAGTGGVGALEALWTAMSPALGGTPAQAARRTVAWLGPCIGPDAFEVGGEVREAFAAHDAQAVSCFRPLAGGKFMADLPALARRRLLALGISAIHGNDGSAAWCTVTNASRFFSHRRDRVSGRFAASVWLGRS